MSLAALRSEHGSPLNGPPFARCPLLAAEVTELADVDAAAEGWRAEVEALAREIHGEPAEPGIAARRAAPLARVGTGQASPAVPPRTARYNQTAPDAACARARRVAEPRGGQGATLRPVTPYQCAHGAADASNGHPDRRTP